MKKTIGILLVVVLVLSLATGCSKNEISLYELSNEISMLDAFEQEGTIEYDFNFEAMLDPDSSSYEEDLAMLQMVENQIDELNLNKLYYRAFVDQEESLMQVDYYIMDNDQQEIELLDIRLVNETFFVNYDGLSELVLPFLEASDNPDPELLEFFGNSPGYIQFDLNEILNSNNAYSPYSAAPIQIQNSYDLKERKDFVEELQSEIDAFVENTLRDFTTDKVDKRYSSSNKADMYTYTIATDDVVDVGFDFIEYFLDHLSGFEAFILDIYQNDSFIEYAGLNPEDKEIIVASITEGFDMIEENIEEIKTSFQEYKVREEETGEIKAMLKSFMGDSSFTYGLGKESSDKYHQDVNLHLEFVSQTRSEEKATFNLVSHTEVTKGNSVRISAPESFITFDEFNKQFPDTFTVNVDYGDYTYKEGLMNTDYGYIDTMIREGRSYVRLESVPGRMVESIKWSELDQKPYYIMPSGATKVFVENFIVENGEVYVAVAEYRNIGYIVSWDDIYRTVTIKTN